MRQFLTVRARSSCDGDVMQSWAEIPSSNRHATRTPALRLKRPALTIIFLIFQQFLVECVRGETHLISPGPDVQYQLQNRLIESTPGDVIQLEEGKYELRAELNLNCDRVTIRGRGHEKTILSFRNQQAGSDGLLASGNGLVFEDLAIEDPASNAIKVLGAKGVTFRRVRTEWTDGPKTSNGAYGIYPVQCTDVLIEECVAIGAADAGIYVGQCHRVIVRGCRAVQNVVGIEIENTHEADVYDNTASGNTGGILVVDLPGLPVVNGHSTRVFQNKVIDNNLRNFAPKGTTVADVPQGTGVMILAGNQVEVTRNEITNHGTANVLILSYLVTGKPLPKTKYDPYSEGIGVYDNKISDGGTRPAGKLAETLKAAVGGRFADIVIDGAQDAAKFVEGTLPESLGIRIDGNGEASFLNFNLAKLNPAALLTGRYKFERDAGTVKGRLPELDAVSLQPAPPSETTNAALEVYRTVPRLLSEWKLFERHGAAIKPLAGVVPYELNTTLFSDETSKYRVIRLPSGGSMHYRADGPLEFPVGTVLAKTFTMPHAVTTNGAAEQLLETRIQVRRDSGWYGFSYQWDAPQRDAQLVLGGSFENIEWNHADGRRHSNRYEIPNANQCLTCHSRGDKFAPLGPTAENLNRTVRTPQGEVNQLTHWNNLGILSDLPDLATVGQMPRYDDPHSADITSRARAWLEVNCSSCHRPDGSARTTGLDLRRVQTNPASFGVLKSPVAAGRGTGGRQYDIVPGKPDESILIHRMESTEPGVRMPSLSRNLVATEGLDLVREWIRSMPTHNP